MVRPLFLTLSALALSLALSPSVWAQFQQPQGMGGATSGGLGGMPAGGDPQLLRETEFGREFPEGSYSSQWWVTGNEAGALESRGIYGQFLWVDPGADVVIVKLSSLPRALDPNVTRDHHRAFAAIAAALG